MYIVVLLSMCYYLNRERFLSIAQKMDIFVEKILILFYKFREDNDDIYDIIIS